MTSNIIAGAQLIDIQCQPIVASGCFCYTAVIYYAIRYQYTMYGSTACGANLGKDLA
jgi:hypothetical protein